MAKHLFKNLIYYHAVGSASAVFIYLSILVALLDSYSVVVFCVCFSVFVGVTGNRQTSLVLWICGCNTVLPSMGDKLTKLLMSDSV